MWIGTWKEGTCYEKELGRKELIVKRYLIDLNKLKVFKDFFYFGFKRIEQERGTTNSKVFSSFSSNEFFLPFFSICVCVFFLVYYFLNKFVFVFNSFFFFSFFKFMVFQFVCIFFRFFLFIHVFFNF